MITIKQDYDLTKLNTFGVPARTGFFAEVNNEAELEELLVRPEFRNNERIFLGGGSNVLFTRDFPGVVVVNKLRGIEIYKESDEDVFVRAMSGEVWHDLVLFAVERGYWGIENLAFVPGTVGAAPMQNIGAYGAELKNALESVEAVELTTGNKKVFTAEECELGYRDSVFKNKFKDKYFITAVNLKLSKRGAPNTGYRVLREYLTSNNLTPKTPKDISGAVTAIRKSKLPDPKVTGNAGSFFKNVFVSEEEFKNLLAKYPDMPSFVENGIIKIPSGWLVEQCGYKGRRVGRVGVHDKQALVLVNHGGATGLEIKALAEEIISAVQQKFGLTLVPEVNLI